MNCPEHIFVCNRIAYIALIARGDKRWEHVTWGERLNPLRWQINLWRSPPVFHNYGRYWLIRWNENAVLNRKWSNIKWKYLGGKKRTERRRAAAALSSTDGKGGEDGNQG